MVSADPHPFRFTISLGPDGALPVLESSAGGCSCSSCCFCCSQYKKCDVSRQCQAVRFRTLVAPPPPSARRAALHCSTQDHTNDASSPYCKEGSIAMCGCRVAGGDAPRRADSAAHALYPVTYFWSRECALRFVMERCRCSCASSGSAVGAPPPYGVVLLAPVLRRML